VSALVVGLALGIVTGMPIGVVNVAIVEAASRGRAAYAARVGVGGALADAMHAAIAFAGVGRVVTERVAWRAAMAVVMAAVVCAYASRVWRRRRGRVVCEERGGMLAGLMLTLPNPGALAAWVAVAAVVWPGIDIARALVLAAGVGAGSALWFAALACWVGRHAAHRAAAATGASPTSPSGTPTARTAR
jgi:arginine exporter protein ArgO